MASTILWAVLRCPVDAEGEVIGPVDAGELVTAYPTKAAAKRALSNTFAHSGFGLYVVPARFTMGEATGLAWCWCTVPAEPRAAEVAS